MEISGQSIIGYSRSTATGTSHHAVNPATGEKIEPPFYQVEPAESDTAANLARNAAPIFAGLSGAERGKFLRAIASGLEDAIDGVVARGMAETGLPEARLRGETARTCGQLRTFAEVIEEGSWVDARIELAEPDRQPAPKPDLRSMKRAIGPVAVFCASNFPLAFSVAGGDTASALAAGCPVIVIAHQSHPGTAELVGMVVREAAESTGMPEGVFSLLFGGGRNVGIPVVHHPAIMAVGFTGSRAGGLAIVAEANSRPVPIPVYAEMSSVNPLVILPGALADPAMEEKLAIAYHQSLTLGAGQFCTNPGLVFLPESGGDRFVAKLSELISSSPPAVMLNSGILDSFERKTEAVSDCQGVRTLAQGIGADGPGKSQTWLFETSIRRLLEDDMLQSEMFGPAGLIARGTIEEIANTIAELEGQLTTTLHGTTEEIIANPDLLAAMEARSGRLVVNGFPTGVEVCSSMVHGGPFPATSNPRTSSVGTLAIERFVRPVSFQNFPDAALPAALQQANPLGIRRLRNGKPE